MNKDCCTNLPDDWKSRWTNLAKVFDITGLGPQMDKQFGGTYFLPRARFYKNLIGIRYQIIGLYTCVRIGHKL